MTDRRPSRLRLNRVDCPGRSGRSGTSVGLAARLGIPAAALLVLAACNPDLRGDAITRPFFTSEPAEVTETASAETVEQASAVPFQQQDYVVAREGDTIRLIAERYGLDPGRIAEFNGVYVDDPLEAGRIILIPADQSRRATSAITEIAESAIAEAESASGTRTATVPNPGTHVVKEGETVAGIAERYGIPEQELRRANNLPESANLAVGEVLVIPERQLPNAEPQLSSPIEVSDVDLPPPPSSNQPLPEAPLTAELPQSPNLGQFRTEQSQSRFLMPVDGEIIRAYSGKGGNEGIDIAAPEGTAVVAAADGEIALVSNNSDDTSILLIRHPNDVFTVYANLKGVSLQTGVQVTRGQTVGQIAGGDKQFLHFEVRIGTQSTDPVPYIS